MPKSNFLPLDLSMFFIIRYVHLLKSVLFSALNLKTRVTPLRCKLYESGQFCYMITKIYVFYRWIWLCSWPSRNWLLPLTSPAFSHFCNSRVSCSSSQNIWSIRSQRIRKCIPAILWKLLVIFSQGNLRTVHIQVNNFWHSYELTEEILVVIQQ